MDFDFTEEQVLIQKTVREFADNEVKPIAAEIDRTHGFPVETVNRMAELGFFGLSIPEAYGGSGSDYISYIMAVETLSAVSAAHGTILSAHTSLCTHPILSFGTDAQKQKYIPDLASGKKLGAFCLTEAGAGTDASAQQTTAELKSDRYVLNGSKMFITNGAVAETFLVAAVTDRAKGLKGISMFIVEKDTPGFVVGQAEEKLGICGSSTTEIILKGCAIPQENILGKEGDGFKIALQTLDSGRIGIASQAVGIAQSALDAAISYAKERKQFGKPISSNQGIQWMLAEMATKVEASRLLVMRAAWLKETGARYSKEAAMAKLTASATAMDVASKSIQIHGGLGYTKSYPVERYLRDAKITEIYEGTSEVQKMVIAANILA